jgi:chromosome segregation ATPase
VLRIIAGLSMFPTDQQVVMMRAMDQADDTWSEAEVLEDARKRQSALRSHLQAVEGERAARIQELDAAIQTAQSQGRQLVEEIERQIAELQIQREAASADTTTSVTELEQQKKAVEDHAEHSRRGITHVINALSSLMGFFGQRAAP